MCDCVCVVAYCMVLLLQEEGDCVKSARHMPSPRRVVPPPPDREPATPLACALCPGEECIFLGRVMSRDPGAEMATRHACSQVQPLMGKAAHLTDYDDTSGNWRERG